MSDVQRDNRVTSLTTRAGIRNSLVTILDQLQRCQKSLNEFLEVSLYSTSSCLDLGLFFFSPYKLGMHRFWLKQGGRESLKSLKMS